MNRIILLVLIFQTLLFAQPFTNENKLNAVDEEIKTPSEENVISQNNYFTGNWWGARDIISTKGLNFETVYKAESFSNISGGNEKGSFYLDNIDVKFELDAEKLIGWNGAVFNIYFLGNNGGGIGDASGAAQGISNIEAFNTWKLYELWYDQSLFDNALSVRVGLYDLNSEFDTRETSSLFINPSHGIGVDIAQSGYNGPSIFPNTSLALRIKVQPSESFYFQTALFDGIPGDPENPNGTKIKFNNDDGLLSISELGITESADQFAEGYSKYAVGAWFYSTKFEKFSSVISPDPTGYNYGIYAYAEKFLYGESEDLSQGLSAFVRAGYANPTLNPFDSYFGAGFTYTGLFNGRDTDVLGLAIAAGHHSNYFRNLLFAEEEIEVQPFEINFELTYNIQLNNWISIQPNFQYVINPANSFISGNALIAGIRATVNF